MISYIYSVKDELTGTFHNPMFLGKSEVTNDEAKRIFKTQINNTLVWKDNPQDFTLYKIGTMDDETGVIITNKEEIANGKTLLERS